MQADAQRGSGRVVRWDAHSRTGAVVIDSLPAEVEFDADALDAPGRNAVEPGELVEVVYALVGPRAQNDERAVAGAAYRASKVTPTD
ncbi:hypothetical protein [Motilibacter aurantiacus]|uniref:hypothetical protein n=1 Tax=Motilibacter aurantiacus TaxID=2714955 RepID=UPI001E2A2569|nr:hypothetical protein [Motilibacter aurantiacus]NHC44983.1 hypothetical protein [Motilibacter aurantiacus]